MITHRRWTNQRLQKPVAIYPWQRFIWVRITRSARNGYIAESKGALEDCDWE